MKQKLTNREKAIQYLISLNSLETLAKYIGKNIISKDIKEVAGYILDHSSILSRMDEEGDIDLADAPFRICDECGIVLYEGYCIENGLRYFCSDACLHKNYTKKEFKEMYANGDGDSYFTSWVD